MGMCLPSVAQQQTDFSRPAIPSSQYITVPNIEIACYWLGIFQASQGLHLVALLVDMFITMPSKFNASSYKSFISCHHHTKYGVLLAFYFPKRFKVAYFSHMDRHIKLQDLHQMHSCFSDFISLHCFHVVVDVFGAGRQVKRLRCDGLKKHDFHTRFY